MLGNCANCSCCHICAAKGISCTPVDKEKVLAQYTEEERKIMEAAAYMEATFYMQYTRIQETAEFARQMGYTKIGLAFCIGISDEAKLLEAYFAQEGFQVTSVCCKNCGISKDILGLKKVHPERRVESMCNPKNQAALMNEAGCQLFVSAGLCVGHDAIFARNCQGPVTTLVVKDRVLNHSPLGAIYSKYWRNKLGINGDNTKSGI